MLKRLFVGCATVMATASFVAAGPTEDVQAAAKKLASSGYAWKTTSENAGGNGGGGGGNRGGGGGQTGKVDKDGVIEA